MESIRIPSLRSSLLFVALMLLLYCEFSLADLSPSYFTMRRTDMVLNDEGIFVFNGRGQASLRDKTITGVQNILFPPVGIFNYLFNLNFRENGTGIIINDTVDTLYDQYARYGQGCHPLGDNFNPGCPFVPVWQNCTWQPNLISRTGTFHKYVNNQWLSLAFSSALRVSNTTDEVYLSLTLTNRATRDISLDVLPQQQVQVNCADWHQKGAYSIASSECQFETTVTSDLVQQSSVGWVWNISANSVSTANFAIVVQVANQTRPAIYDSQLSAKVQAADLALLQRFQWATDQLPVLSNSSVLEPFYYRCILSVLNSRWTRENFFISPFYAVGTWIFSVLWDTSFASGALVLLEPESVRNTLLAFAQIDLMKYTYIPWSGIEPSEYWYAQTPFAFKKVLNDYMAVTGDTAILDTQAGNLTVLGWLKEAADELIEKYTDVGNGHLLTFGGFQGMFLEMRTDGYVNAPPGPNLLALDFFQQVGGWLQERNDTEGAEVLLLYASKLSQGINSFLWRPDLDWFVSLWPDGSQQLVMTYHLFDALGTPTEVLSQAQKDALVSHLTPTEFLAPNGMYSVSQSDTVHWDLEDVDWGGGGQYTGMPLRIVEELFRLNYSDNAWDILLRCAGWSAKFPYFPQELFGSYFGSPTVEQPLEIANGAGVSAIVYGVFGLRPNAAARQLVVAPTWNQMADGASLSNFQFLDRVVTVTLTNSQSFSVELDGAVIASGRSYYDPLTVQL